jgi:sialate O-acetylesterase
MSVVRALAYLLVSVPLALRAEVSLPAIFSDHLVLMKAPAVPVWGKAEAGEKVRVIIGTTTADAETDATGRWQAMLNLKDSVAGPFEMSVEGKNRIVIHDVVIGEVWLASGQSNMELPLRVTTDADAEIARSANPFLRQFLVKKAGSRQPADDCQGQWTVAAPETAGEFTAVGYYFGKELQQSLQRPVGIIHASHGGTYIEPWTPADCLDRIPSFKNSADAKRKSADEYPARKAKFAADFNAWLKQHERTDETHPNVAAFADEHVSMSDWAAVDLPGKISPVGFPSSGVFWLRRDIEVSALVAKQGFKVMIGPLAGYWQVYWNGQKVDDMPYSRMPGKGFSCYFAVPLEHIRAGKNTLAIRIFSPTAPLAVPGRSLWAGPIDLGGKWLTKVERAFPELAPEIMQSAPPLDYRQPDMLHASLYNAMIHPLVPSAIAGVLWYQGESNAGRAFEYRTALTTLIQGWREKWRRDDLPFYFCQVCNNFAKVAQPGESAWAELRESQSLALALPHTAQAVTIDLGEAGDLHPRDKKTLGHRLFLIAESEHYGQHVERSGPVFDSMRIEDGKARLHFNHSEGGLVATKLPATYPVKTLTGEFARLVRNSPHSELEGFAVCGDDHKWVWADAMIEGENVLVRSDQVKHPVAVRYGWAENPTCNLSNGAGLPASPFRTDDFPVTTQDIHY